jgi:hypothetical protein
MSERERGRFLIFELEAPQVGDISILPIDFYLYNSIPKFQNQTLFYSEICGRGSLQMFIRM